MKQIYFYACLLLGSFAAKAQTNPTPQALPYTQNFSVFTGSATTYPAGWQGWTVTGSTSTSYPTAAPSGDQILASGTTAQNSAVSAFVGDAVGKIAFLNTSAALKTFVLAVNTSGVTGVQVSFLAATQRQQTANRIGGMGMQYRVGTSGLFTDVAGSEYQNDGLVDNTAGTGSLNPQTKTVTLPAACNNQPEVQLRWIYREVSGSGNRPGFSVTNITVNNGSTVTPSLTTSGSIADFGNIVVGNNSTSQTFSLSGTNLSGAPGVITVTAPSTDFQVSNNNTLFGATTTIAYASATLASTPVYIRFTPQTAGPKTGNISITGGGVSSAVLVPVSGTGTAAPTPTLTASALTTFANTCINTTAGPNSFTINGSNLTAANVTVGPLTAYTFSTTSGGSYTSSLSLPQTGGIFSQTVFVQFLPTAIQSYNGNIPVAGGGFSGTLNVPVTAAGADNAPTVNTTPANTITTTSAVLGGSIFALGCSNVTSYGIEYSLTNGFANGTGTNAPSSNYVAGSYSSLVTGLASGTTYYFKAYAVNNGGKSYGPQQSFTTASPLISATGITAFGTTCANTTVGPNSFTITGTNLSTANVLVGAVAGFTYSTTSAGTYTSTLSLTQPGGAFIQVVYVKFTPTAAGAVNGSIPVTGGGASSTVNVVVSGTGINTPPTVTTGSASAISRNGATLAATVTASGCSAATSYGIEYSSIGGFADGQGKKVQSSNLAGGTFSTTVNGLVQNSKYYYKAFSANSGGISYGTEMSFTSTAIPAKGLVVYSSPVTRGGTIYFTLNDIKPGHYAAQIFNSLGQLVYQKDMILQVNFVDDYLTIPSSIVSGLYTLQIASIDYRVKKSFMIK